MSVKAIIPIQVTHPLGNGRAAGPQPITVAPGTRLAEIAASLGSTPVDPRRQLVAAYVDRRLAGLDESIEQPCHVEFIGLETLDGRRVYQRTILFLLCAAVERTLPGARVIIEHSLSNGIYGEIHHPDGFTHRELRRIEAQMRDWIEADLPIRTLEMSAAEAARSFDGHYHPVSTERLRTLFAQLPPERRVTLHEIDGYRDYLDGPTLPRTSDAPYFSLRHYLPGFIVQTPEQAALPAIPPYKEQPGLFRVYRETERWAKILGVSDVPALNRMLEKDPGDLIRIHEALHEKKIARLADQIAEHGIRIITIAGPSSSGKTTFAQRLRLHLRVLGLKPLTLHLDDYFYDRARAPLDEEGNPDFESIETIDLPLFHDHLCRLVQGFPITPPRFNFATGEREWHDRTIQSGPDEPIIIEGIHGLNDRLTESVPKINKFQIYISALTHLTLHDHVRIHTTDVRLIRRMVRDAQFRAYPAADTIARWPSVRRGEERWIFPFQEQADAMFNSALLYELAVLKPFAEAHLEAIPRNHPTRPVADRLLWLLSHFNPIPPDEVPPNSILREFIGGSAFNS